MNTKLTIWYIFLLTRYINTLHATENKKVISIVLKEYSVIIKWHILILTQFPLALCHPLPSYKKGNKWLHAGLLKKYFLVVSLARQFIRMIHVAKHLPRVVCEQPKKLDMKNVLYQKAGSKHKCYFSRFQPYVFK